MVCLSNSTNLSTLNHYKDQSIQVIDLYGNMLVFLSLNFTLKLSPNDSRDYEDRVIVRL